LVFKIPLPLGISNDLPWGGNGFFLEVHSLESITQLTSRENISCSKTEDISEGKNTFDLFKMP